MKLGRYLEVLRTPGVARVVAFATTGRLPFAIVPLSIVLLMRQEGYHYGQIGAGRGRRGARGRRDGGVRGPARGPDRAAPGDPRDRQVALPAFAEAEGSRGAVGPLITVWALGSVIGGLWYGARAWNA